jgi:radical SAM superfamily enzyme YgiQ (UPF0313 family)
MSSLGFQVIYTRISQQPDTVCERAFLPDDVAAWRATGKPLVTYESGRPIGDFDVIAFSLSYELEISGVLECLDLAGVPILARDRDERHPLVVIGGPLTFSNPVPSGPFADVIVMGEAEIAIEHLLARARERQTRDSLLRALSELPGLYLPSLHGESPVDVIAAPDECLPAASAFLTPHTELASMHLVESERGCHRACTFCVMRRSTNGGMRLATPDKILATIPDEARKVGLVGAAVSDHPQLLQIVRHIVDSGRQVSLSSLRADRLTPELMEALKQGGYKTVTVASDGASERLRIMLRKNIRAKHLVRAAELVRDHGLTRLKVYMIIGLPGETDEDLDELVDFTRQLAGICKIAVGIAPFVAKRNTPLDRQGFAGIKLVDKRLKRLRKELGRTVDLRSTSARWAWVEYCLAQGGFEMGMAVAQAWRNGLGFAAYKRAILQFGEPQATAPLPVIPRTRAERLAISRS